MPEPTTKLALVDENYVLPINLDELPATDRAKAKVQAQQANAIKEGRRRERELSAAHASGLKSAHVDELGRLRLEWLETSKHSNRASLATGALVGSITGAVLAACGTAFAMSQGMFGFAATQRAVAQPTYEAPAPLTVHDAVDPVTGMTCTPSANHRCPAVPASAP